MGMAAVQYKIMPSSPDVDLGKILDDLKSKLEANGTSLSNSEEQPIAFGLKALVISFGYPEEKEIEELGNQFSEIENISSVEMVDYRRALG